MDSPCKRRRLHAVTMCAREACPRRFCGALCDLTAFPWPPHDAPTARTSQHRENAEPRRALWTCPKCAPSPEDLDDHTASNGDATGMLLRSRRPCCAQPGVLHFSWTPRRRRGDAASVGQAFHRLTAPCQSTNSTSHLCNKQD